MFARVCVCVCVCVCVFCCVIEWGILVLVRHDPVGVSFFPRSFFSTLSSEPVGGF